MNPTPPPPVEAHLRDRNGGGGGLRRGGPVVTLTPTRTFHDATLLLGASVSAALGGAADLSQPSARRLDGPIETALREALTFPLTTHLTRPRRLPWAPRRPGQRARTAAHVCTDVYPAALTTRDHLGSGPADGAP